MKRARVKAIAIFDKWRGEGVPLVITASEAHHLTGGLVGVPYDSPKRNDALNLSSVAVKYAEGGN